MDLLVTVVLIIFFVSMFWTLIAILTKHKYKIPGIFCLVSLVILLVFVPKEEKKEKRPPKIKIAQEKEKSGIDISGKSEEQRIREALDVANEFLEAVQNDNFEKAYDLITSEYYNLLSLESFKAFVSKEYFIKEIKPEHFWMNRFGDYRTRGENVWFDIPKDLVPKIYFCLDYRGEVYREKSHEVIIWLEDKTKRHYTDYRIIVGCIRLIEAGDNMRSQWKVEHIYPGPGTASRVEVRAEKVLYRRKLR